MKINEYHIKPGDIYGRLTAIEFDHMGKHNRSYFRFRCQCGKEKVILGSGVKSGNTRSCGCLSREVKAKRKSEFHTETTAVILGYKRHAKGRGFAWDLSRNEVGKIISSDCFYCGSKPNNHKMTRNTLAGGLYYSGIDRVDSLKGYSIENVVPCCKICNYAKSNTTLKEFHEWALRLGKLAFAEQWGALLDKESGFKSANTRSMQAGVAINE